MEIVHRKLTELVPNPKNPRESTDDAIKNLAESIKENPDFFEARPILLSDRTGKLVIIGGEQRFKAAKLLKMKTAPTILISGLTEEREDYIMANDNTHAGKWDVAKLQKIAEEWGGASVLKKWNIEGIKWPTGQGIEGYENLPPELLGHDLSPDKLPEIVGEDKVAMERIIIVYPANKVDSLKSLLGVDKIDKVVYQISELIK